MKKILIVDDDADHIQVLRLRLRTDNYEVVTASDGDEGIQKAEKERPDLIILDVAMPKMDGHTMAHAMRLVDSLKRIPVIVTTGRRDIEHQFSIDNVKGYFVKPYDGKLLLEKIHSILS